MNPSNLIHWGGLAVMIGGPLWLATPLRDPVFGGGATPDHPVFRPYNAVVAVIAVLLIVGLASLHARYKGTYRRLGKTGAVVIFVGYMFLLAGSIPAVLLDPDGSSDVIRIGQDLGFLGALVAGAGAILLGVALWRTQAPRLAALLLILTLPVGLAGVIVISSIGLVSVAGLAMTVPYGVAWMVLGHHLRSSAGDVAVAGIPGSERGG
jgi:heme/copper-type cytochrome/quinol oxidase subunit 1